MSNYILKLKWAWQASFLSHTHLPLEINANFIDLQMILKPFCNIFNGLKVENFLKSKAVHISRGPRLHSVCCRASQSNSNFS